MKKKSPLNGLLKKISAEELKAFIVQYSDKNTTFKSDFELYFSAKSEFSDIKKLVRDQIRSIIKKHTKRQFIDYSASRRLANELQKILVQGDRFLVLGNLLDASILSMVYIREVTPVITYSDDSAGSLGEVIDMGISLLTDISLRAPAALKEKIAAYLKKELEDELYFDYGNFGYDLTHLYTQLSLDLGQVDDLLGFIDAAIEAARLENYDYRISFFIELKTQILQKANRIDEAMVLMEQHIHLPKVRKMLVEQAIEEQRIADAKTLLAEGIRIANEMKHEGTVIDWQVCLLQIAEMENDLETVRHYLEKFAFGRTFNESFYKKWKHTYSNSEWSAIIEKKIASIRMDIEKNDQYIRWKQQDYWLLHHLGPIYTEEKMFDRLLELLKRHSRLNGILTYHPHLFDKYPGELMQIYLPLLDQEVQKANDRRSYRQLLEVVHSIHNDIPAGRADILLKLQQWKVQYSYRPALVDEINKLSW